MLVKIVIDNQRKRDILWFQTERFNNLKRAILPQINLPL